MRIGALQPGYLPWLGFFEQMASVDLFILYDELSFSRRVWRNRNRIKTPTGARWLTVPVEHSSDGVSFPFAISDARVAGSQGWARNHWETLRHNYARAPWFDAYAAGFRQIYARSWTRLNDLDVEIIRLLAEALGIRTRLALASDLGLERAFRAHLPDRAGAAGTATERILFLLREIGATVFYEGAAGRAFVDEGRIFEAGYRIEFQDYHHPIYPQLFGEFIGYLSAVDLLFNCGDRSLAILTGTGS